MRVKDIKSFQKSLEAIEEEKGIGKEVVLSMLNNAVSTAYRKHKGLDHNNLEVEIEEDGNIKIYVVKKVVENVEDENLEISLEEARLINEESSLEDEILLEENCDEFRRNAIQNAKQVVIQKVREVERNNFVKKFENKLNKLVEGTIKRIDPQGNIHVEIEEVETFLPVQEQSPTDVYKLGMNLKVCILNIVTNAKVPKIIISRKSNKLVKALFEFEIPEIEEGVIEIKGVAREAGSRTKIALLSHSPSLDPIAASVGPKGIRINTISRELNGEKIDIIRWHENIETFIMNALTPAKVEGINLYTEQKVAEVIVGEDQYGLAIGKKGQNAKLASILTGLNLNIRLLEEQNKDQNSLDENSGENESMEDGGTVDR